METLYPVLLVVAVFAAVKAVAWWVQPRSYARSTLAQTKNTPIAELAHGGWAKITGVVAAAQMTESPLDANPCVGFRLEVKRTDRVLRVLEREACGTFSITDETGTAEVDGPFVWGLDFDIGWTVVSKRGLDVLVGAGVRVPPLMFGRHFEYREALLLPGDRVSVYGQVFFEPDPTARGVGLRSPPLLAHMRGSRRDRVVIANAGDPGSR